MLGRQLDTIFVITLCTCFCKIKSSCKLGSLPGVKGHLTFLHFKKRVDFDAAKTAEASSAGFRSELTWPHLIGLDKSSIFAKRLTSNVLNHSKQGGASFLAQGPQSEVDFVQGPHYRIIEAKCKFKIVKSRTFIF